MARNSPTPATTSTHPVQSRALIGRRDHQADSGTANSRSMATIGATSASGPKARASAASPYAATASRIPASHIGRRAR